MKDKKTKREEAQVRNSAWNKLSPTEQLAHMDKLGIAGSKQREKISLKLK